jgi:hypothetical protein
VRVRAWRAAFAALAVASGGGENTGAQALVGTTQSKVAPPPTFAFDSLDARPVSSEAMRGKPCVIAFVAVSEGNNLASQAQVDFLVAMAKHDAEAVNYAVVALEPRENRELVEILREGLKVPFPIAMADAQSLVGGGPFGELRAPVTVLLDRGGHVAWRVDGRVASAGEIRAAMKGL